MNDSAITNVPLGGPVSVGAWVKLGRGKYFFDKTAVAEIADMTHDIMCDPSLISSIASHDVQINLRAGSLIGPSSPASMRDVLKALGIVK